MIALFLVHVNLEDVKFISKQIIIPVVSLKSVVCESTGMTEYLLNRGFQCRTEFD